MADHGQSLTGLDPALPEELHDRAADNWRPLVAIADQIGIGWPARARAAALEISNAKAGEADFLRALLLADMRDIFRAKKIDRIKSEALAALLASLTDRPWNTFDRGRPITTSGVARMLKPYGIFSATIRLDLNTTAKGYTLSAFNDAFARYLAPEG